MIPVDLMNAFFAGTNTGKQMTKKCFRDLITVNEAFNSKFDEVKWAQSGHNFHATASLKGESYELFIEVNNLRTPYGVHTWLNLAFARIVNGAAVQTLVNTGENQSFVFGAVLNALKEKVNEIDQDYEVDAVALIAVSDELKRIDLYKKILSMVTGLHPWKYTAELNLGSSRGTLVIGTKQDGKLNGDVWRSIKADMEAQGKPLIR